MSSVNKMSLSKLRTMLQENKRMVDETILDVLPKNHKVQEIELLYSMMRDYPMRPAKGLRSSICLLTCAAFGGNAKKALMTATAIELFQNWILIHDDVEDASELRRGEPVLQKKYNVPLAINAGDALHGMMWDVLYRNKSTLGESQTLAIINEFLTMIHENTEGQHIELSWLQGKNWDITEEDYFVMCVKKTAWYTCITPCRLGLLAARGVQELKQDDFVKFGESLGLAFQIHDDVLNLSSDTKYGKEHAGDIFEGKRTLILIHLLNIADKWDKERLMEILTKDRMEKTESEVDEVLSLITKYGAAEYAKRKAWELSRVALEEFNVIFGKLPDCNEKSWLRDLTEYMVTRDW